MERAILARHGESVFNVLDVMNGDIALPGPLTSLGREQARALGETIHDEAIDLCITSEFERARETAEIALAGRNVPRLVASAFNDPLYGPFEGGLLEDYRGWASSHPSDATPGDGGESRFAIVERYERGFRELLERPESTILVVAHSLPVAYALGAREGLQPGARVPLALNATPHPFSAAEIQTVVAVLGDWLAAPGW